MGRDAVIILPTYNEAENIENALEAFLQASDRVEILVVDDESPDGTAALAEAVAQSEKRVSVFRRTGKRGLAPAYIAGFERALAGGYQRILQMDADFSHPPQKIPELLAAVDSGADLAVGSRYVDGGGTRDWGIIRKVLSRGGGLYARAILGVPVQDLTAGFTCWNADLLRKISFDRIQSNGYGFQIEMKYRAHKLGARIQEVPIIFADRELGTSKMSPGIALEAIALVWKIRFSRS